jgi:hypothetical protein
MAARVCGRTESSKGDDTVLMRQKILGAIGLLAWFCNGELYCVAVTLQTRFETGIRLLVTRNFFFDQPVATARRSYRQILVTAGAGQAAAVAG